MQPSRSAGSVSRPDRGREGEVRIYNQRVGRTRRTLPLGRGSLHRRVSKKNPNCRVRVQWRRTCRWRDVTGRRTVRWMDGLPKREIRWSVFGAGGGGGPLGDCLGFGAWGFRLIPLLLQATTVLRAPIITVLILVVRVVIGQSYYRCPDVETVHLPICPRTGPGLKSWGRKWGEMGKERRHVKQGSRSGARPLVGPESCVSLPSGRNYACDACIIHLNPIFFECIC